MSACAKLLISKFYLPYNLLNKFIWGSFWDVQSNPKYWGNFAQQKVKKNIGNMANLKVLLCLLKQKYLTLTTNKIWLKSNQYTRLEHKNNVKTVQTDPSWRHSSNCCKRTDEFGAMFIQNVSWVLHEEF